MQNAAFIQCYYLFDRTTQLLVRRMFVPNICDFIICTISVVYTTFLCYGGLGSCLLNQL